MAQDRVTLQLSVDDNMTQAMNRAATAINGLHGPTGKATSGFSKMQASIVTMNQAFELVGRVARTVSTAFLAVVETADQFKRAEIQLTNLTGSSQDAGDAMDFLIGLSQKAPVSIDKLQNAFVKLTATGIENTERALTAVTDAVAAFGGSDQELQRATVAISQMAGKGVISMEELRQQLGEAIPTAIQIMARELDLTTAELFKKVELGALDATTGINALIDGFEKDFSGSAEKMMDTWGGATKQMSTAWDLFLRALGEAGVLDAAIATVKTLTLVMLDLVNLLKEDLPTELTNAQNRLEELNKQAEAGGNAFGELDEEIAATKLEILELTMSLDGMTEDMEASAGQTKKAAKEMEKFKQEIAKVEKEAEGWETAFSDMDRFFDKFENESAITLAEELEQANLEAELLSGEFENIDKWLASINDRVTDFNVGLAKGAAGQIAGGSGAIQGFEQAGPMGAVAGFFTELLLGNEKLQEALKPLNEALFKMMDPIADAIAPSLEAMVPLIEDLKPAFKAIGAGLKIWNANYVFWMKAMHKAVEMLTGLLHTVNDALRSLGIKEERLRAELSRVRETLEKFDEMLEATFEDLVGAVEDLFGAVEDLARFIVELPEKIADAVAGIGGGGGSGKGKYTGIPGSPIHSGGMLTREDMLRIPGASSNEGLFFGKVGERVSPAGADGDAGGGGLTFIMQGNDPDEIVRIIEEQRLLGRWA